MSIFPPPVPIGQVAAEGDPRDYCTGGDDSGFLAVVSLGAATVPTVPEDPDDEITPFDAAEAAAGLSEINLTTTSSFPGEIWGLDVAMCDFLFAGSPLGKLDDGTLVYSLTGLLSATSALFGPVARPRFPLAPRSIVTAAAKWQVAPGPGVLWATLALGVPAGDQPGDTRPRRHARLLMERTRFEPGIRRLHDMPFPDGRVMAAARSVERIGAQRGIRYGLIFAGLTQVLVREGMTGCAGTFCPYIRLAPNAVPPGGVPESLTDWQKAVRGKGVYPATLT